MNPVNDKRKLAFARFPGLIRDALRDFRQLTGFTAVTALCPMSAAGPTRETPLPPVHPRCAKLLRKLPYRPPCEAQWRNHLRVARKTLSCLRHTCPLGLHCACVPIILADQLLGLAKFVSGPEISAGRFHATVDLLELLISRPCQTLHIFLLRDENQTLKTSLNRLRSAKQPASFGRDGSHPNGRANQTDHASPQVQTLIGQVLDYLYEHFTDCHLSLTRVARTVGKNEKYLAHLFAQQVGNRMRTYITTLRVRRACELLLETSRNIKEIASDCGFANAVQFRHSFRRTIGVTATEYRQVFAPDASSTILDRKQPIRKLLLHQP